MSADRVAYVTTGVRSMADHVRKKKNNNLRIQLSTVAYGLGAVRVYVMCAHMLIVIVVHVNDLMIGSRIPYAAVQRIRDRSTSNFYYAIFDM